MGALQGGCPKTVRFPAAMSLKRQRRLTIPTRTEQNIIDSDGTLILYESRLKGGTLLTRKICRRLDKPHLAVRMDRDEPDQVCRWLAETKPSTLNVAGPRESNFPGICDRGIEFLMQVFAT